MVNREEAGREKDGGTYSMVGFVSEWRRASLALEYLFAGTK